MIRPRLVSPAAVLGLLIFAAPAAAQTSTWTGASGTDWNSGLNWSPNGVPTSSSNVVFPSGAAITNPLLTAGGSAASLLFDAGATSYTLQSNSGVSLTTSAITVSPTTTATQTINLANMAIGSLLFPAGQTLAITNNAAATAASSPTLVIGPSTTIGTPGSLGIVVGGTGTTTISGSFADSSGPNNQVIGGLTKNGPGTLVLSGNGSNMNGPIALNGGTLRLDYSTNISSKFGSGGLTSAGGDLVMVPHASTGVTQNVSGTSLTAGHTSVTLTEDGAGLSLGLGAIARSTGSTLDLPISTFATTTTGNTSFLLGTGPAFATINGSRWAAQSGGSVISVIGSIGNFSAGTNTVVTTSQSPATFTTNSLRFQNSNLTLSLSGSNTIQSGGILVLAVDTGTVITGGTVTTPGGTGELLVHAYGPLTINSKLATSGGLTKTGPGTLTLGANNFNVGFTGPITVNRGGLRFTTSAAVGDASAIIFNDNAARGDGAQTLTLEHGDNLFSGLGFVSSIRFSASANGPNVFPNVITTGVNNDARVVIAGVISSAPGVVTPIRFDGQGSDSSGIILQGTNTFTGPVELRNGTLEIDSNANLGNPANPLFLNTGNALGGGLEFGASGIDLARSVHLSSPARITSNGTDVNTISGPLSGSTFLFKAGNGTLAVTGPSTFTGELRIEAGTLRANAAFLAAAGPIKLRHAAVLSVAETASLPAAGEIVLGTFSAGPTQSTIDVATGATFTVNGVLSDESGAAATLVKTGLGTLVLNPSSSTYSGGTTVRSGVLHVADDASLGAASGPVAVEQAGTIRYTATTITSRTFNLAGGQLEAPSVLIFNNAAVNGGFLVGGGTGLFVTQNGSANTFVGNTTSSATIFHLDANDSLTNFTNNGSITKTSGPAATLTRFTNTSSGRMDLFGAMQVSEFVSNGQIHIAVGGSIQHLGNSNLVLGGGSRTFVGTAASPGGSITMMGGTTIELNGALFVNNGTVSGTVNVNFGSLAKGSGTYGLVNVNQGGVYAPGNSPGISKAAAVNFDSTPTMSGAPTLMMELAGTAPGTGHDQLQVTGQLSLGGKLEVLLSGPFTPQLGNTFDLLNWGTRSGGFSAIELPTLVPGLAWNAMQLYQSGAISVVDINLLPGDFNRDLKVTAADISAMLKALTNLATYQAEKSLTDPQLVAIGDLNLSGRVTNQDIQLLLNIVPTLAGNGSLAAVPEPSAFALLAIGCVGFAIAFRRAKR